MQLNGLQQEQLQLMRSVQFNQFDGERVVNDLLANRDLWTAAMMVPSEVNKLVALRELACGEVYVDTFYLLAEVDKHEELLRLTKSWKPDSITEISGDTGLNGLTGILDVLGVADASEPERVAIRLWWD